MTRSPVRLTALCTGGLFVALAIPPLMVALDGGGELAVGPLRLAFYDLPSAGFCLVGLLFWLGRRGRGGRSETWLAGLSLASLAVACLLLWLPPTGVPELLSIRPGRPLIAGVLLLGAAALASRVSGLPQHTSHVPGTVALVVALTAGAGLHGAMVLVDRVALSERLGRHAMEQPAPLRERARSASAGTPSAIVHQESSRPNLLLVVVDTLRADAVSKGNELPFFTALAEESLVFERAIAPAPWTVPSMMSLMTGRYPSSFDPVGRGRGWPNGLAEAKPMHSALPRLGELLSRAGYRTAGFVKNPFLAGGLGFEQGFDVYERVHGDTAEHGSAEQLVNAALRWADAIAQPTGLGDKDPTPWFLYLHFMDPHVNYQPPASHLNQRARDYAGEIDGRASTMHRMIAAKPEPDQADLNQLKDLYSGEVHYLDEQLGRLFAAFRAADLLGPETVVVLTADHGEQFGEHGGWLHGDIHSENVRVPLLLQGPGVIPGSRDDPASLVDLLPTLAQLLDLPSLSLGDGRNLLAPGASSSAAPVHTDYGELSRLTGPRFSLLLREEGQASLYDHTDDPGEEDDVSGAHDDVLAAMLSAMETFAARDPLDLPAEESLGLSADGEDLGREGQLDTEALRAIGYFDG